MGWKRTCVIFLTIACGTSCLADGVYRDGVGARSVGRGGTNIGFSDNGEILLDNPAGLSNIEGRQLIGFGIDVLVTDIHYQDPDNNRTGGSNNPFPVGQLSLLRKSENGDWAYGLGVYSQAGFGATYDLNGPAPFFSGQHRYKSLGALSRILSGVSHKLTDNLSIGGSFGVAVSHVELEGPYTLQGPSAFQGTPILLDMQGTGVAPSWSVGLQYAVSDRTRVGLSFLGESNFSLDGNTQTAIPLLPAARFDSTLDIAWPRTVGAGLNHQLTDTTTIAMDLIWVNWAKAFDSMALHLSNPNDPTVAAVTGGQLTDVLPLNWGNTVSFRSGIERRLQSGGTIRAGYVHHANPIPSSTLTPFIQTTLQHSVSIGYGWNVGNMNVDLAYQFSFGDRQDVGVSDLAGGDFDNSSAWVDAHWFLFEVTRTTK